MSSHNWGPIGTAVMTGVDTGFEWARRTYIRVFTWLVIASVLMVALGVTLNKWGYLIANFYIAAVFLILWAFLTFYPGSVAIAFGIGGLSGLPKDWSINRLIREGALPDLQLSNVAKEGLALVQKYIRWSAHLAFFVAIVFVTLGTWRLENGKVVLPVFVVLSGIGLWAALFTKDTVWYKRVTIIILLAALVGLVYTGYTHTHPQDETVTLIDETLMKNEDLIKEQAAKALHEKVQQGIGLTPKEVRLLESLRHESKRAENVVEQSGQTIKSALPSLSSPDTKGQVWDTYDHVEYPLVWNEELDGPWCNAMELPPGTYRVIPTYDAVILQERGADDGLYDIRITPDGILLGSKWNIRHPFYREFLQQAPLGGNQRVGSFITRVGTGIIVESWKGETFTLTKTERVRPCGINLPPNKAYLNGSRGMVTADIERLRQ